MKRTRTGAVAPIWTLIALMGFNPIASGVGGVTPLVTYAETLAGEVVGMDGTSFSIATGSNAEQREDISSQDFKDQRMDEMTATPSIALMRSTI